MAEILRRFEIIGPRSLTCRLRGVLGGDVAVGIAAIGDGQTGPDLRLTQITAIGCAMGQYPSIAVFAHRLTGGIGPLGERFQIPAGRRAAGKGPATLIVFKGIHALKPYLDPVQAQGIAIDRLGFAGEGGLSR